MVEVSPKAVSGDAHIHGDSTAAVAGKVWGDASV